MDLKKLIYLFSIILNNYLIDSQNPVSLTSIKLTLPTSCPSNQYFDISHLSCQSCPDNSISIDTFNCKCNSNYYFKYNDGGGSISCVLCPDGFIQSLDGYTCVKCDQDCLACASSGGYLTDLDQTGNYFTDNNNNLIRKCYVCNQASSRLNDDRCVSCKPLLYAESANIAAATCNTQGTTSSGGLLILDGNSATDPSYFNVAFGNDNTITSWYYTNYLLAVYRTCRSTNRRNVTACQTLGNLCVLNLYISSRSGSVDACTAFTNIQSINTVWGPNLPWLTYSETYGTYKASYISFINSNKNIALTFSPTKCEPTGLAFYAAIYSINGSLISFNQFDLTKIQLCNIFGLSISKISPFSASYFNQQCNIPINLLLDYGSEPVFYDFYIKYGNASNLFPIPVKTLNYIDSAGNLVNLKSDETNQKLQRRFFLVDSLSAKTSKDSVPKYIRYAKIINFQFTLVEGQTQGAIYPPIIAIEYDYVSTNDLTVKVKTTFQISYLMSLDQQVQAIWISVGVIGFFAFVGSIFRTWIWNRRSGKLAIDIITLFKFIMYFVNSLSNVFFVVTIGVSLYWLIFYKGQGLAYVFIPQSSQEDSFKALLIIAFAMKFFDIVYLILVQCSYDVFFIDWERPRLKAIGRETFITQIKPSTTEKAKEDTKLVNDESQNYNTVSCWRSLFVANEWNEIQVFRKINPSIQLILLLFFLKVVNLESLTRSDCNSNLYPDSSQYQAPYSGILRVAMASSMYIAIGLLQYIFYNFIYIRCVEDKTGCFIDFCSVANISIFIMTHSQYGYYIHGRSPYGNSDTSMQQMAQALQKEENNLLTKRGLEEGSDHQTFSVSLSNKLSKQYSKVMNPVYEQKSQKSSGASNNVFEKKMLAYTQLNRFLIAFIDNILREMKYIIVKRNFLENVLDFEFKEPILAGYFYKDNEKSFENVLFCGKERQLFIFDLLVFLIVDYFAFNYVLAALITYIVMTIYRTARHDLGKQNISRKTLVDKRFLI